MENFVWFKKKKRTTTILVRRHFDVIVFLVSILFVRRFVWNENRLFAA